MATKPLRVAGDVMLSVPLSGALRAETAREKVGAADLSDQDALTVQLVPLVFLRRIELIQ